MNMESRRAATKASTSHSSQETPLSTGETIVPRFSLLFPPPGAAGGLSPTASRERRAKGPTKPEELGRQSPGVPGHRLKYRTQDPQQETTHTFPQTPQGSRCDRSSGRRGPQQGRGSGIVYRSQEGCKEHSEDPQNPFGVN